LFDGGEHDVVGVVTAAAVQLLRIRIRIIESKYYYQQILSLSLSPHKVKPMYKVPRFNIVPHGTIFLFV